MAESKIAKKITGGIVTIVILAVCLCITTFALIMATLPLDNNLFKTGSIKINLNDGKQIIDEHEFLFEPGMTVKKDFFVQNESTCDVYYKLYFENTQGGLSDVLQIKIKDGDTVLYSGTAATLAKGNVTASDMLAVGQRKVLTVWFYYPQENGNSTQNSSFSFDMCADAVQTKNNPDKLFE